MSKNKKTPGLKEVNTKLKKSAVNIKGKQYVLVSDRIVAFNALYPSGSIQTELISDVSADVVYVKAKVTPDIETADRFFTGYSQARWGEGLVNKTSALENAETSAVGRALAMMGIGVIDSIASADEMSKAMSTKPRLKQVQPRPKPNSNAVKPQTKAKMLELAGSKENLMEWIKKENIDPKTMLEKDAQILIMKMEEL